MCYCITFSVPGKINLETTPSGLHITPFINQGGGHSYPTEFTAYSFFGGECCCDLIFPYEEYASLNEFLMELENNKKQGKSHQIIDQAIAEAKRSFNRSIPIRKDVESYLITNTTLFGTLQFIVHWHSEPFETEAFQINKSIELQGSNCFAFESLEEDVRYILKEV